MVESVVMPRRASPAKPVKLPQRFVFTAPLVKMGRSRSVLYALEIPQRVTTAIGRRGPVPIVATLNRAVELQASLVPMGDGKHRLQLNTRIRRELEIEPGDAVRVELLVPEKAPRLPVPSELSAALKEADLAEMFAGFPVGKQNHIIQWIEEAARPETRGKRVRTAVEVTFRAREHAHEKQQKLTSG